MDIIEELCIEIDALKKKLHTIKKGVMSKKKFLHSGEMKLVKVISNYEEIFKQDPTLINIAKTIEISQATVTVLATRLIAKGLVKKTISSADRRVKYLSLTDKGHEYLQSNQKRESKLYAKLSSALGKEDSKHLVRILKKVNKHLEEEK